MECIFCKIVAGELPSKKIYEDEDTLAFMDINPANPGHALVIPKKHYENIFDIDEQTLKQIISVTKKVAERINEKLKPEGLNILQNNGKRAGQLVNHIHVHIIPRFADDKVLFTYQKADVDDFDRIQKEITVETPEEEPFEEEKKEEPRKETISRKWRKDF